MNVTSPDDILSLLNVPIITTTESSDVQSIISDSWQPTEQIKNETIQSTIPIVILEDGQIAVECNGQYFLMSGIQNEETVSSENLMPESVSVHFNSSEDQIVSSIVTSAADNVNINKEADNIVEQTIKAIGEDNTVEEVYEPTEEEEISNKLNNNDKGVLEKFVYLCSQCPNLFNTLHDCKIHMISDHNMILSGDENIEFFITSEEEVNKKISLPLKPIDTNSNSDRNCSNHNSNENSTSQVGDVDSNSKILAQQSIEQQKMKNRKSKIKSLKVDPDYDVRLFKCKHVSCAMKFRSSESLTQHSACHKGPNKKDYACSQCSYHYDDWKHCSLHLWNAHGIDVDLYTCGVCNVHKATSRVNLEIHMKIHREEREYACPICDKKFKQKSQARNHRITHMNKNDTSGSEQPPRWYMSQKCNICFKTYSDSKCLKKHIQAVHSKLKPFVCHVCGHSSARKAMLQAHLRQHTGEKPYACPNCPFRTGDHNSLRRHVMRHSGKKPYKCPHCSYAAIQSTLFKQHVMMRHPGLGGVYNCNMCSFSTVNRSAYILHLSDHKNNLIPSTNQSDDVEVFPENVAAAQLVYQCMGASSGDGSQIHADLKSSSTSDDGTKQTIMIEIPTNNEVPTTDDEDTASCFLRSEDDTGGITIPADPNEPIVII